MTDWIGKLEQAKRLLDAGALTPEEFEAEKLRLLPRNAPEQADSKTTLSREAARRKITQSRTIIALGVVSLTLAGGAVLTSFLRDRDPAVNALEGPALAASSGPSTAPPIQKLSPVRPSAVEAKRPEAERGQCGSGDLRIDLPGVGNSGTVVVNYPLDDTDAMGELQFAAQPFVCVTSAQLSKFASPSGNQATASDVLVSYSPTNIGESPLKYSVLMCDELPDTPRPPRSVKVGSFQWLRSTAPQVSVRWYPDYRAHIEANCF